jgi:hypothetical protein
MEKLVLKGKKEIRMLLADSLHQTVQALGVTKSKKKAERLIEKSSKRLAAVVAEQMKKELKKLKAPKAKKEKKVKEAELELQRKANFRKKIRKGPCAPFSFADIQRARHSSSATACHKKYLPREWYPCGYLSSRHRYTTPLVLQYPCR